MTEFQKRAQKKFGWDAIFFGGNGPYALLAWCGTTSFSLWPTMEDAEQRMASLTSCGGRCEGRHEIVDVREARIRYKCKYPH